MNTLIRFKKTTPLLFVALALINVGLLTPVKAVDVTDTFYGNEAGNNTTTGLWNSAFGFEALFSNTTGHASTATGYLALYNNNGQSNTASGFEALYNNTSGFENTASGVQTLFFNTSGNNNTATGVAALGRNTTGSSNIALGLESGSNLTTGDYNIDIGNDGVAAEANTIRIGDQANQTATYIAGIHGVDKSNGSPVFIDANGQLGTGTALQTGAILQMRQGQPAPAGFTKIGTSDFKYKDLTNHARTVTLDVYQKN